MLDKANYSIQNRREIGLVSWTPHFFPFWTPHFVVWTPHFWLDSTLKLYCAATLPLECRLSICPSHSSQ